jgi:hypothetical protein
MYRPVVPVYNTVISMYRPVVPVYNTVISVYRPVVPVYTRFLDQSISAFQSISRNSEGHVESVYNCVIDGYYWSIHG